MDEKRRKSDTTVTACDSGRATSCIETYSFFHEASTQYTFSGSFQSVLAPPSNMEFTLTPATERRRVCSTTPDYSAATDGVAPAYSRVCTNVSEKGCPADWQTGKHGYHVLVELCAGITGFPDHVTGT